MQTRFIGKKPDPTGTVATIRLNNRAQPSGPRIERYEDPRQEMLAKTSLGVVSDGGSKLTEHGIRVAVTA